MTSEKYRGVFEHPKGSGIWWIHYYDADGRRHREKIGRRSSAIRAYVERKIEIRGGQFTAPGRKAPRISFEQLGERVLEQKRTHISAGHYLVCSYRWKNEFSALKRLPAAAVTPQSIETALRGLYDRGLSGSTCNRYRSFLSSIFSYAVRDGIVPVNPCVRVPKFKESDHRIRFLAEDEEAALRQAMRSRAPAFEAELDLAINTGMRRGEQFSLKWENVDLDRGTLTVFGKTGRRFVPVNSAARAALLKLYRASNGSAFVCQRGASDLPADRSRWFREALATAKIENFRWHDRRHTFASRLVMAGVDIRTVQELLGHKSILMTMRYAHLSPDHKLAAVERIVRQAPKPSSRKIVRMK